MRKFRISLILILFSLILLPLNFVSANRNLNIYFFWGDGCPHCEKELKLLNFLENKQSQIRVYDYDIYESNENVGLLKRVAEHLNARVDGVPFTVIGDKYFVGFSESITSEQIEDQIDFCLHNQCLDSVAGLLSSVSTSTESTPKLVQEENTSLGKVELPVFGKIDLSNFSLPTLTVVMGALDGFNPCAMWALLFLISILLGMKDKKRMWFFGGAFIFISAFVYFLFMAAWLNFILFLGFIKWVRYGIGVIALVGGGYNLKRFLSVEDSGCIAADDPKKQKIFEKIKSIVQMRSFWLAFLGISLLAFSVNLVELLCSAGFPAVYTQILAMSNLNKFQYYSYILFYIFVFMLDDLFVFFAAMITLELTGVTTKYTRATKLIGGILMIIIGILLILKPELLMFG